MASADEIERLEIVEAGDRDRVADVACRAARGRPCSRAAGISPGRRGAACAASRALAEAMRPPPSVADGQLFTPRDIMRAIDSVAPRQAINRETRAVHAAAFWEPSAGTRRAARGRRTPQRARQARRRACARACRPPRRHGRPDQPGLGRDGAEDRRLGIPVIVAISAPTALAVRTAEAAGITLVAIARGDGFEIFTHPRRIAKERIACVA